MSVYTSSCLSDDSICIYVSFWKTICPSIYSSICLSICLFVFIYLSVNLSEKLHVNLSVRIYLYLSVNPSVCLSIVDTRLSDMDVVILDLWLFDNTHLSKILEVSEFSCQHLISCLDNLWIHNIFIFIKFMAVSRIFLSDYWTPHPSSSHYK